VAYAEEAAPSSYLENGQTHGVLVDIASAMGRHLGSPMTHQAYPWARAQAMVKTGQADMMITAVTPERLEYAVASQQPVFRIANTIIANSRHPALAALMQARDLEDLRPYEFISYTGNGWTKTNLTEKGFKVSVVARRADVARLAAIRDDLLMVDAGGIALLQAQQQGLPATFVALPVVVPPSAFYIMVSRASPYAARMADIDKAVQTIIADGVFQRALLKHATQ
jgi:polar amino acid transport system substrate-binding protein